jgi:hypothetical protein
MCGVIMDEFIICKRRIILTTWQPNQMSLQNCLRLYHQTNEAYIKEESSQRETRDVEEEFSRERYMEARDESFRLFLACPLTRTPVPSGISVSFTGLNKV